jgi:hypothetical protein
MTSGDTLRPGRLIWSSGYLAIEITVKGGITCKYISLIKYFLKLVLWFNSHTLYHCFHIALVNDI